MDGSWEDLGLVRGLALHLLKSVRMQYISPVFTPGSFPEGFCGCYSKEQDGKLYVGFRFSAVFGFFETGNFGITIPVKGDIKEVILKTKMGETPVWNAE